MNQNKKKQQSEDEQQQQLEPMVRARTAELTDLIGYMNDSYEDERRRLARELHDELGSILTAAKLDISFIKSKFAGSNQEMIAKCERVASMLDQGAALKRRLIEILHPSTLDMLGLAPAVRELVENFSEEAKVEIECAVDGDIDHRDREALIVYRVIEEALENIARHARATKVEVTLERIDGQLHVAVRDNGRGFDPLASPRPKGRGLSAIRQRLLALEGSLQIESTPGAGTGLHAWVPIRH